MKYLTLVLKRQDEEIPIAFCWYNQQNKKYIFKWLINFNDENLFNNNEIDVLLKAKQQISDCMKTKLMPYVYKVIEPWSDDFWVEADKLLKTTPINIVFLSKQ